MADSETPRLAFRSTVVELVLITVVFLVLSVGAIFAVSAFIDLSPEPPGAAPASAEGEQAAVVDDEPETREEFDSRNAVSADMYDLQKEFRVTAYAVWFAGIAVLIFVLFLTIGGMPPRWWLPSAVVVFGVALYLGGVYMNQPDESDRRILGVQIEQDFKVDVDSNSIRTQFGAYYFTGEANGLTGSCSLKRSDDESEVFVECRGDTVRVEVR